VKRTSRNTRGRKIRTNVIKKKKAGHARKEGSKRKKEQVAVPRGHEPRMTGAL